MNKNYASNYWSSVKPNPSNMITKVGVKVESDHSGSSVMLGVIPEGTHITIDLAQVKNGAVRIIDMDGGIPESWIKILHPFKPEDQEFWIRSYKTKSLLVEPEAYEPKPYVPGPYEPKPWTSEPEPLSIPYPETNEPKPNPYVPEPGPLTSDPSPYVPNPEPWVPDPEALDPEPKSHVHKAKSKAKVVEPKPEPFAPMPTPEPWAPAPEPQSPEPFVYEPKPFDSMGKWIEPTEEVKPEE